MSYKIDYFPLYYQEYHLMQKKLVDKTEMESRQRLRRAIERRPVNDSISVSVAFGSVYLP